MYKCDLHMKKELICHGHYLGKVLSCEECHYKIKSTSVNIKFCLESDLLWLLQSFFWLQPNTKQQYLLLGEKHFDMIMPMIKQGHPILFRTLMYCFS